MTLAFDIETLGKLEESSIITCICLYDGVHKWEYRFWKVSSEEWERNRKEVMERMDEAPRLAGFHAMGFDIPFMQKSLQVETERIQKWMGKCQDPFVVCRDILHCTCSLNKLLELNGLGLKTGTGGNAIELALEEKWESLLAYCMMDTVLTYELCTLPSIRFSNALMGKVGEDGLWRFSLRQKPQATEPIVWKMCENEKTECGAVCYECDEY